MSLLFGQYAHTSDMSQRTDLIRKRGTRQTSTTSRKDLDEPCKTKNAHLGHSDENATRFSQPNPLFIPFFIQLVDQPVLVVTCRRPATAGIAIISIALRGQLGVAGAPAPTPGKGLCARRKQCEESVSAEGASRGPCRVVWKLAPAALVHDCALVGDAAE